MRTAPRQTAYERHAPAPELVTRSLADSVQRVFWSDELAPRDPFASLDAALTADLVVVGGGYLGLWTALLAKRRTPAARVVLLEGQSLGWAASSRNGGFCEASISHGVENARARWPEDADTLQRLGRLNLDAFETDITELGLHCEWERTGALTVAVEQHELDWLDADARLDRDQVRAEIDSHLFLAGAWERHDNALLHPARLVRELARAATELGVEIFENTQVVGIETEASGPVQVRTPRAVVRARQVALATNVFPSLLRRTRLMTVPVYDYVLMTEPLTAAQLDSIGWRHRQGLADLANQFHYARLSADDRILWGGYDAVYHRGRQVRATYEDRPATFRALASHFLAAFPQLEGIRFTHRWAGAIDTSTQFAAFHGLARHGRVAYAAGFTGLGVGATRFAAEVMLDRLAGETTERTELAMVRRKPMPFPPEPVAGLGIGLTRWSLDRADHRAGQRNLFLRTLDAVGLGFDS